MEEIGRELKRRREVLGLSLQDVQAVTKIRSRYLSALESGEPEAIPGEVFVKGFLKVYADYLGLDGEEYVARYKAWARGRSGASAQEGEGGAAAATPGASPADGVAEERPGPRAVRQRRKRPGYGQPSVTWKGLLRLLVLAAVGAGLYVVASGVYGARDLRGPGAAGGDDGSRRAAQETAGGPGTETRDKGARPQEGASAPPPGPGSGSGPGGGGGQPPRW